MVGGPGATKPLFVNASAVATILSSGDRDSMDQVGAALQPDVKRDAPTIRSSISLRSKDEQSAPSFLRIFLPSPG